MTNLKLRIKHPSGAEFEAEGPAELILSEKAAFLSTLTAQTKTASQAAQTQQEGRPETTARQDETGNWSAAIENTENGMKIRIKHPEIKAETAALILITANKYLNNEQATSAIDLSKALRKSGYMPDRLDRLLAKPAKNGWIRASGTKRNRTYQTTARGQEIAWLEARKLTQGQ